MPLFTTNVCDSTRRASRGWTWLAALTLLTAPQLTMADAAEESEEESFLEEERFVTETFSPWLEFSVGRDSNVAGSALDRYAGATGTDTLQTSNSQASTFLDLAGGLDVLVYEGSSVELNASYMGSQLIYTKQDHRDLSVQMHHASLQGKHSLGTRIDWRWELHGGGMLAGMDSLEPLLWSAGIAQHLDLYGSPAHRTRITTRFEQVQGLGDNNSLDGFRLEAALEQRAWLGPVDLRLRLRIRDDQAGEQQMENEFVSDQGSCSDEGGVCQYVLPLSYLAPSASLRAGLDLGAGLDLALQVGLEWRDYHDPSFVQVSEGIAFEGVTLVQNETGLLTVEDSVTTRQDLRATLAAELNQQLGDSLRVFMRYDMLWNQSTVALDQLDPTHRWDADDRNYTQHVLSTGIGIDL